MRFSFGVTGVLSVALLLGMLTPLASTAAQESDAPPADDAESPKFVLYDAGSSKRGGFGDIEIAPGQTADIAVAVENIGTVPLSLRVQPVNVFSGVNGGVTTGDESAAPEGPTAWVDLPEQIVDLDPAVRQDIAFTVTVPEDTEPGQYATALVGRTVDTMEIPGVSSLDYTIGYAVSLRIVVPGEVTYGFELGTPEVEARTEDSVLRVPITNTGNFLVKPAGQLTLANGDGEQVFSTDIEMKSVFGGSSTVVQVSLPEQMPLGEYTLNLSLTDADSGVADSLENVTVTVPKPKDPRGVNVESVAIAPNADPIAFANVDLTLSNGGKQIPAANVVLEVSRDGEPVEDFPLATKQVLVRGDNEIAARYIPADAWEPGTYTFRVVVTSVDPEGGMMAVLLDESLSAEITVP